MGTQSTLQAGQGTAGPPGKRPSRAGMPKGGREPKHPRHTEVTEEQTCTQCVMQEESGMGREARQDR